MKTKEMDELKNINDFIYKILADLLFKILPEYRTIFELENNEYNLSGGVYLFMNEFASFLCKEIEKDPKSIIVNKAFTFINKVGESNNLEILNILRVGILEILYTSKNVNRELVSNSLSEKLREYFHEFSRYYN